MNENFSASAKRCDTRMSRGRGREEANGFKESRGYRHRLKNAMANFLRNLREHLHDVHDPG